MNPKHPDSPPATPTATPSSQPGSARPRTGLPLADPDTTPVRAACR